MSFHSITILIVFSSSLLQFSDNFAILLFHYDGHVTEWDEFECSKRAIHISVSKQTKWCATMLQCAGYSSDCNLESIFF
ncbi:unnamed protein product [Triticum turgidum subsp. durum]|uniref:Secreted protein n=1 Tax=Triticum turgidum subsp. durum TaxID=4567 RepID=A0A9R1A789_TRITD|nr:unnamed protein product [Triticum turgidum subsp. durum]